MIRNFRALGRMKAGVMNRTEQRYAEHLELRRRVGELTWVSEFEPLKFRLADKTFYTPDFIVLNAAREMEAHDVKGFWTDDARVKIKVAAGMYPVKFVGAKLVKGCWELEEF